MTDDIGAPLIPEIDIAASIKELEASASKLTELILTQPTREFLGYAWSRLVLNRMTAEQSGRENTPLLEAGGRTSIETIQLVLEYAHAAWSANPASNADLSLDEAVCEAIFAEAEKLSVAVMRYCMWSSMKVEDGEFGSQTREVDFAAKSNWVLIRGNRYQVLEEEFLNYVLGPHSDALEKAYGVPAGAIATGLQQAADAMRTGFGRAAEAFSEGMASAAEFAESQDSDPGAAHLEWSEAHPEAAKRAADAAIDMFRGGVCNLSRQTNLPAALLEDLSFDRGENVEFYAPGPFRGTPLRTLPARIKPAVRLEDGVYATDPMFIRDAAYRALQRGLLARIPEYRPEWEARQKLLSEAAFPDIFEKQLKHAKVYHELFYKDAAGNWAEADTVIVIDDVLIQVEAKAGVAAMHSPATDFKRHVRAIKALVLKAREQTERFLNYVASAREVPLFRLDGGTYIEIGCLRKADFRVILPIGLTVEAFTPFSAMCKELPGAEPILGAYPFISMSIDDLFVLNRSLPSSGELLHYLQVRQTLAGMKRDDVTP